MMTLVGLLNICETPAEKRRVRRLLADYGRSSRLARRKDLGTRWVHLGEARETLAEMRAFLDSKPDA